MPYRGKGPVYGLDWLATKVPLYYKSQKFIKVDVPIVAVFYRFCQLMAFGVACLQLYMNDGWAMAETPGGMANAWDESGTMLRSTDDTELPERLRYCSNPANSYAFRTYELEQPECEVLMPAELTTKTMDSLFFTTSIVETATRGWPCAAADAAERSAECTADGGIESSRSNGQCICRSKRAIYPLAVEEMEMAFEHAYATTADFSWFGSSAKSDDAAEEDEEGLISVLRAPDGTEQAFPPGEPLVLPLSEWLTLANVSLDDVNDAVPADPLGRVAPKRSTGVNVRVDIAYSNADRATGRAVPGKRSMHAEVSLRAESATWTGVGTTTMWLVYPTEPRHVPQEYHLIERWRHGVLFQFHLSGKVYQLNWFYLLTVAVQTLVLLKAANLATDAVAFYCLPNGQSAVLRNKRQEIVSKRSEFAEIGMKAALAAATYRSFDPDNNGSIEAVDIVRVFAHVEGVSWEQAHAIAHMILDDADTGDEGEVGGAPGLSYVEYMTCLEGDAIDFDHFLKCVEKKEDAPDRDECRKAFYEERNTLPPVAGREGLPESPSFTPLGLDDDAKATRRLAKGTVRVTVKKAQGLRPSDKNGLADPYALGTIGKKHHKTKAIPKTLTPEWDEQLQFRNVTFGKAVKAGLVLQVMDKDSLLDADDVMESITVDIGCLEDADSAEFVELMPGQGTIEFTVEWVEGADTSSAKKPKKKAAADASPDKAGLPSPAPLPPPMTPGSASESDAASPDKKKKKKEKTPRADADLKEEEEVVQTM